MYMRREGFLHFSHISGFHLIQYVLLQHVQGDESYLYRCEMRRGDKWQESRLLEVEVNRWKRREDVKRINGQKYMRVAPLTYDSCGQYGHLTLL